MTKTQAAVVGSKSDAARSLRTNNKKQLSSECGRRQRSRPCTFMWSQFVSLAANFHADLHHSRNSQSKHPRLQTVSEWLCLLIMAAKQGKTRSAKVDITSATTDDAKMWCLCFYVVFFVQRTYCTAADKSREPWEAKYL